jgi:hypothetical protein
MSLLLPRAPFKRFLPTLLAGLSLTCAAPESAPATGPVADQVQTAMSSGRETFDHSAWDELLRQGTRDGLVDYGFMKEHRPQLDAYLERVATVDLSALTGAHLEALLLNAYNALTVRSILDHPGVASIRDIDGVWTKTKHTVGGQPLTLDEIEHNLLRPFWKDPRIHFGVNCASRSCAPLPPWAFTGEEVDRQLEERTRAFLQDPDHVRVEGGELLVSKYFDWYGQDFTASGWSPRADTLPAFITRYARPEVARFIEERGGNPRLRFLDYDWALNQAE